MLFSFLRLYYKGRTETIRPVTTKSVQFCKVQYSHQHHLVCVVQYTSLYMYIQAFDDPSVPPEEVKKLLKASIE